jgi:hypothetical protein
MTRRMFGGCSGRGAAPANDERTAKRMRMGFMLSLILIINLLPSFNIQVGGMLKKK